MSTEQKSAWGYQNDNDESLKSKQGGKFGLNSAHITVLEFNPNAGAEGAAGEAVDITVSIGDKEFRSRVYDITGDLYKGDNTISPDEPGYNELYNTEKAQREAVIVHAVKALGASEAQIQAALAAGNVSNFATWAVAMCGIKPANFATLPVDAFVEWQWSIGADNDRTFLQLPKNMKGGRFLCPAVAPVGKWNEVVDGEGLRYVDDANNEHPFTRSANYMSSNKAKQQIEGQEEETSSPAPSAGGAAPAKSKW